MTSRALDKALSTAKGRLGAVKVEREIERFMESSENLEMYSEAVGMPHRKVYHTIAGMFGLEHDTVEMEPQQYCVKLRKTRSMRFPTPSVREMAARRAKATAAPAPRNVRILRRASSSASREEKRPERQLNEEEALLEKEAAYAEARSALFAGDETAVETLDSASSSHASLNPHDMIDYDRSLPKASKKQFCSNLLEVCVLNTSLPNFELDMSFEPIRQMHGSIRYMNSGHIVAVFSTVAEATVALQRLHNPVFRLRPWRVR